MAIPDTECDFLWFLMICLCEQGHDMYALDDAVEDVSTVNENDAERRVIAITPELFSKFLSKLHRR